MVESDGIEDAVAGAVRVAVMAAAWRVEQSARRRQQEQMEAARGSVGEQRAARVAQQVDRDAARGELMFSVDQPGWWDTATPEQVGRAWETAQLWRGEHPDVERQARLIEREVRDRWGIDPEQAAAGVGLESAISGERFVREQQQRGGVDPVAASRDVPSAGDQFPRRDDVRGQADRVDLAVAGPVVARPGDRVAVPSVEELANSRPDAQRAAARGRGVSDPRAVEAAALAGAHQVRSARAATGTLTAPAPERARRPGPVARGQQRDGDRVTGR
jgi:hypothetical protein